MKINKIYKHLSLVFVFLMSLTFSSCETYDDYKNEDSRIPVVGFTGPVGPASVTLSPGGSVEKEIEFFVSNQYNFEQSFTVNIVQEETEVSADNYSFNSTVTIPPNTRTGVFTITLSDVSLSEDFMPLVIGFADGDNYAAGSTVTLRLRKN